MMLELIKITIIRRILITVLVTIGFHSSQSIAAQNNTPREYEIKAAFLYNFAKFIEWPEAAFSDTSAPIVFGVLGDDPFKEYLDALEGKKIKDRPIEVKRFKNIMDVEMVHVIFISISENTHLKEILAHFADQYTLTVGDVNGFTENGGIINFVNKRNKIRFEVNMDASESAHLKISSKLLKLAEPPI